jgi:hypothetical protein
MVSGFNTSPLELPSTSSGEAKPMEILEKLLFTLLSFLKAMIKYFLMKNEK